MGTSTAPPYANLVLAALEQQVLEEFYNIILLFQRFIDDILLILYCTEDELHRVLARFNSLAPKIKIDFQVSNTHVQFLDVNISIASRKLEYSTYHKEINLFQYISPSSFHPKHIYKAFIHTELTRYLRTNNTKASFQ